MDSVEIGLLTCSPRQIIYGLYGHTAIRYHDLRNGADWTFNYGMFNFKIPFFALHFALGLTDYELGVVPFNIFCEEYSEFGCSVTEQVINLSPEEKIKLRNLLEENYKPENRVYRYNYFYDNCTTRARDMLIRCINGRVEFPDTDEVSQSYRKLIHTYTAGHPWAGFANDLALGVLSDRPISKHKQQFLPANLMHDVSLATVVSPDGKSRPFVKITRYDVKPSVQVIESEFPLTPTECGFVLLIITLIIMMYEQQKKNIMWWYDMFLMFVTGVAGCLILFLFFSQHPTTSTNLMILILNPVPLFFIHRMIKRVKKRQNDRYFYWSYIPIILFISAKIFNIQDIPWAMVLVALCLLLRNLSHNLWEYKVLK